MPYKTRLLICICLPVLLCFSAPCAQAQSFFSNLQFSYNGSLLILASDNGKYGADPAQIVPSAGFSAAYPVMSFLNIEFTENIYFVNYQYNTELEYAMACSQENRKAFVAGFTTGIQAAGVFPVAGNGIRARVSGGLAMDLRLVVLAAGLNHPSDFTGEIATDARKQTDAIAKYFWSEGRFLFAPVVAGMDFPINSGFLLGFDLSMWAPLYRLWTDKHIPDIDGWRFGIGLRITPQKKLSE